MDGYLGQGWPFSFLSQKLLNHVVAFSIASCDVVITTPQSLSQSRLVLYKF